MNSRIFVSMPASGFLNLSLLAVCSGLAFGQDSTPPVGGKKLSSQVQKVIALRGFGTVTASGTLWQTPAGQVSLVRFACTDASAAKIVASKYLADLTAYGAVSTAPALNGAGGTRLSVRHGGEWLFGITGKDVFVAWAPTAKRLGEVSRGWGAAKWQKVPEQAYPRFLDSFDNASLGLWWMPTTKSPEILDFVKSTPAVFNIHEQRLNTSFAPGVYDTTGSRNTMAQAHLLKRPYRLMLWEGLPQWLQPAPENDTLENATGATSRNFFEAGVYYRTQATSDRATAVQQDTIAGTMQQFVNDPNLLSWMEPHGEFHMTDPLEVPPNHQTRYPLFLQKERKYTLESISKTYTGNSKAYKSWAEVPYPDNATFAGRREHFLDLDDVKWHWHAERTKEASLESGIAQNWHQQNFDDSAWPLDYRDGAHMMQQSSRSKVFPLWSRFTHEVSADWLRAAQGKRVYLHMMPFTAWEGGEFSVWVNGKEIAHKAAQPKGVLYNSHTQVDVTDAIKSGSNHFVLYSNGGHFRFRVFLSTVSGEEFPFKEASLNQRYLDWRDYYRWEKLQTLAKTLRFMRGVDPNRPFKVMTPHLFQSEAMDLFGRYGAYPQLTGEGGWYRPMHYKGYARLHGLPSSSEGGGDYKNARESQNGFGMIFWESQDIHDYVFDVMRDLWTRPESVQWWRDNTPLLRTLGKTDFGAIRIGVLRDTEQDERYDTGKIWNWDMARGPLPMAGISPVLIDGGDFTKGLADRVPVIFDCATTVITPEMTAAIERYVQNGGIFVAQHHTGQHTPLKRDAWILPKAFGLSVEPRLVNEENFNKWPLAKIRFGTEQNLWPSLRGKEAQGSGVSIDWKGATDTGALSLSAVGNTKMESVAKWEDGSTAIAQVQRGKGRFILLGTPFFLRFRDQNGVWLNEVQRQAMLDELLTSLKVRLDTKSSEPQVWLENRESKNGLYNVYMSGAVCVKNKDWRLSDSIPATLKLKTSRPLPLIEAQAAGLPDVKTNWENGWSNLGEQQFAPYQIRQFAAVRENVGLNGPFHWLQVQSRQWRALESVPKTLVPQAKAGRVQVATSLGLDGLDVTEGWKLQVDPAEQGSEWTQPTFNDSNWRTASLGSWLAQGFPQAKQVRYRRQIKLPTNWGNANGRLVLGLRGYWAFGVRDKGNLWLNGQPLARPLNGPFEIDVTKAAASGTLNLAMQVESSGLDRGPIGTMYLRRSPLPAETLDLTGTWQQLESWEKMGANTTLPASFPKVFGLKRSFKIPERWKNWRIQLVVETPSGSKSTIEGLVMNERGYTRMTDVSADMWSLEGLRLDRWLKPGDNTIELFGGGHTSTEFSGAPLDIRAIRLEAFPLIK